MAHCSIGQERFGFAGRARSASSLDTLGKLIDWASVAALLEPLYSASKGEPAWPPLAMFKALLLSIWYDLSDVKLAEALDDRASFRRFCGFSGTEATPERTAFVRFRKELVAHKLDRSLFLTVTAQLNQRQSQSKLARWSMPRSLPRSARAIMTLDGSNIRESGRSMASRRMSVPMPTRRWSRKYRSHLLISMMAKQAPKRCPTIPARCLPTVPIAATTSVMLCGQRAA